MFLVVYFNSTRIRQIKGKYTEYTRSSASGQTAVTTMDVPSKNTSQTGVSESAYTMEPSGSFEMKKL